MASLGTLSVNIGANTKDLQRGFKVSLDSTRSFAKEVTSIFGGIQMSQMFSSMLNSTKSLARSVIELAANAELAETQFGVLLQDADKGKKLFAQLDKFTLRTSFSMDAAAQAATLLLAKGTGEADVIPTMSMLGDLTMGNVEKLQLLAKAYSDVQAKGFLMAQETMQFAENGVNLFDLLTKTTGKTVGELLKMRETGQITFAMVQGALQAATRRGGQFYGALEKGNKTFYGQMGQLTKSIQVIGRSLGQLVLPELTQMVTKMNLILQGFIAMPNKVQIIQDVLIAVTDVSVAYMMQEFDSLVVWLGKWALRAGAAIGRYAEYAINPIGGIKLGFEMNAAGIGDKPLEQSIQRLKALMKELETVGQNAAKQNGVPAGEMDLQVMARKMGMMMAPLQAVAVDAFEVALKNVPAVDLTQAIGSWLETLGGNSTPIVNGLKTWLGTQMMRWDIAMAQIFQGKEKLAQKAISMDPRNEFAGAVQQGTAEAYAAIAAALKQEQEPVVKATEKQTETLMQPLAAMANALKTGLVQKVVGNLLD